MSKKKQSYKKYVVGGGGGGGGGATQFGVIKIKINHSLPLEVRFILGFKVRRCKWSISISRDVEEISIRYLLKFDNMLI